MKVNEEKGTEKECPRKGRIRSRAQERGRKGAMKPRWGTVEGEGGEEAKRRLE